MQLNFVNEPELDFSQPEHQQGVKAALDKANQEKGLTLPLVIDGERISTGQTFESINPANKTEVCANIAIAKPEHVEQAIQSAYKAFATWRKSPLEERIDKILKLNDLLRENRYELIAWMALENGKNWAEADGEVCELIDFNKAYIMGMQDLDKGLDYLVPSDSEDRECIYIPIGVGVAISPWNFPLALIGGMVTSALITGNTIVMKPSSDTATVAYKFYELVEKAGFPAGTVNFISGRGGEIGDLLVGHKLTRYVTFTGSKEVGLHISELASKIAEGQIWMKRVVAEMGGKNAIIVDETADVDAAAAGIVNSAFSLQGQKCSACSRVIAHSSIADELIDKVVSIAGALEKGTGADNKDFGPVISKTAFDKIASYIDHGKANDKLLLGGSYSDEVGYFLDATIFEVTKNSRIATEEIFGPVLGIMRYDDFDDALAIANSTEYALTGSLYTQDEARMKTVAEDFHVGNLYINHKSTGAVVHQHPFGGFNMSGTDAKTGTTDYLQNFVMLKSITRTR